MPTETIDRYEMEDDGEFVRIYEREGRTRRLIEKRRVFAPGHSAAPRTAAQKRVIAEGGITRAVAG